MMGNDLTTVLTETTENLDLNAPARLPVNATGRYGVSACSVISVVNPS